MPVRLNLREIMLDARTLMKTGRVSPIRFTLFLLLINGALSLVSTAANYVLSLGPEIGISFLSLSFTGILVSLISNVLSAGYNCYCLGLYRREHMPYDSLFDGFAFAGKVIGLMLVEGFFVALWSMLFFFPGVIAMFRYSFAMWNLCQDPSLGVFEALRLSKRQTRGYKLRLLMLYLHFALWYILIALLGTLYGELVYPFLPLTLTGALVDSAASSFLSGVFSVFLTPYLTLSVCGFYLRATGQYDTAPPHSDWTVEF